jgi:8-oxo-dGTP pyrophosphatase MutT (NUDIX family)
MIDFQRVISGLENRLKDPLPGTLAHEPMRAVPSGSVIPKFEHKVPPKPGSVLILIYPGVDGGIRFPLIKRPDYLGAHSGQVSFPGGKAEEGETAITTALREAEEEVGVQPSEVNVLGKLSDFFVVPSNFMVTPVVGYATKEPIFIPDKIEVSRILQGEIEQLISDDAPRTKEILAAGRYQMMAPHFEIEGEIVWGATAMMLNELRMILRDILVRKH